jgi:hypothetical protein
VPQPTALPHTPCVTSYIGLNFKQVVYSADGLGYTVVEDFPLIYSYII